VIAVRTGLDESSRIVHLMPVEPNRMRLAGRCMPQLSTGLNFKD
jgi:hypothetical protein